MEMVQNSVSANCVDYLVSVAGGCIFVESI
jgi:hypothetical protein